MKFDYIIGNPPYQDNTIGENDTYAPPVYDKFMDVAYEIGDKVELIHPARFLFNAGSTSKAWNKKMLEDNHFKVLYYEQDSSKVFVNTDIKGGVTVTYRDTSKDYGVIEVFCPYEEANLIRKKVIHHTDFKGLDELYNAPECYRFTDNLYKKHPEIKQMTYTDKGKTRLLISKGHDYDLSTNILEKLNNIVFFENPQHKADIEVLGRKNNVRTTMYIDKDFIKPYKNLNYFA